MPPDESLWGYAQLIAHHDPRASLRLIDAPILALFGGEDRLVPVDASVRTYEELGGDVMTREFAGADHRCQIGDPPVFADGYLELLTGWIRKVKESHATPRER